MSTEPPGRPGLSATARQLRDFWNAVDVHRLRVRLEVGELVPDEANLAAMLDLLVPDPLSRAGAEAVALQRAALVEDDWAGFEAWLARAAADLARRETSWAAWFRAVRGFRIVTHRRIDEAYGKRPMQLRSAKLGIGSVIDLATHAVGEALAGVPRTPPVRRDDDDARRNAACIEAASVPMLTTDASGRIATWNRGCERAFGHPAARIVGKSIVELFPSDRRDDFEAIRRSVVEGTPIALRTRNLAADGRAVDVELTVTPVRDAFGELIGSAAVIRDLTEAWRAEQIAASAIEAVPLAVVVCDVEGRIVMVNRRTELLLGWERKQLIGEPVEILIPESSRKRHIELRGRFVQMIEQTPEITSARPRKLQALRRGGGELAVEIMLAPLRSQAGQLVLATIAEVTDARQDSGQLERTLAELERSNRELEQFAYVASHDLQEPLRMVASYTELLRRRYQGQLDAKADMFIEFAVDGAKRMQQMVSDLLAYSRVGSRAGSFVPTNVEAVIKSVLSDLSLALEESGAAVDVGELPTVVADPRQLGQVFQNLLGNAIKFRRDDVPPHIVVTARREEGRWVFRVQDNGIGIEPRYAERVFGMFQRLHARDRYPGSGIGLTISQRIVERHGGTIWVEPTPGGGSTFCFTLPLWPVSEP